MLDQQSYFSYCIFQIWKYIPKHLSSRSIYFTAFFIVYQTVSLKVFSPRVVFTSHIAEKLFWVFGIEVNRVKLFFVKTSCFPNFFFNHWLHIWYCNFWSFVDVKILSLKFCKGKLWQSCSEDDNGLDGFSYEIKKLMIS